MKPCSRPLDSIDAEALAAGAEPLLAADAAEHARACSACGAAVAEASSLAARLDALSDSGVGSDLAEGVLRLRPFSRRERFNLALWRRPSLLSAALFCAGLLLLALPGITAREQASLGLAALAPLFALLRAAARALAEGAAAAPAGLSALSESLRGQQSIGLAALLLLLPAGLGLRRVLARARR